MPRLATRWFCFLDVRANLTCAAAINRRCLQQSAIPQNGERGLVLRTIVYSDRFGEALKLNHNSPLFYAVLNEGLTTGDELEPIERHEGRENREAERLCADSGLPQGRAPARRGRIRRAV